MPWSKTRTTGVVVALVCVAGLVLGVAMLRGSDPLGTVGASGHPYQIGDSVETNFGFMAVNHAEAISGLNDSDVTGAHGVPGLVHAGTIDVQVSVTLTNSTTHVLKYSPTQFELLDGQRTSIPLERAAQVPGELQPQAAIDITLDFVTTTDARPFTLRLAGPPADHAVLIELGAVGCTVQSGNGKPLPVTGGCAQTPAAHQHDDSSDQP